MYPFIKVNEFGGGEINVLISSIYRFQDTVLDPLGDSVVVGKLETRNQFNIFITTVETSKEIEALIREAIK